MFKAKQQWIKMAPSPVLLHPDIRTVLQGHSSEWQILLCGTVFVCMSPRLLYRVSKLRDFLSQHENFWQSELHQDSCGDKLCQGLLKGGLAVLKRPLRYSVFLHQEWTHMASLSVEFPLSSPLGSCGPKSIHKSKPFVSLRQEQKREASLLMPLSHAEKILLTAVKRRNFWQW